MNNEKSEKIKWEQKNNDISKYPSRLGKRKNGKEK